MKMLRGKMISIVVLLPFSYSAAAVGQAVLAHLPSSESARLRSSVDRKQLPKGAEVKFLSDQEFVLKARGQENLAVISVAFRYSPVVTDLTQCGLYFIGADKITHYVAVSLGAPEGCTAITGVGLASEPGPRPRLIVVYEAPASRNGIFIEPVVLTWDRSKNLYAVDDPATVWISLQEGADTVPQIRHLLATRH